MSQCGDCGRSVSAGAVCACGASRVATALERIATALENLANQPAAVDGEAVVDAMREARRRGPFAL